MNKTSLFFLLVFFCCIASIHANVGNWTWIAGDVNEVDATGVFGTKGIPNATNQPPADAAGGMWVLNDTIYLFGGFSESNALWKYENGLWSWIAGNDDSGPFTSVKGESGEYNSTFTPSRRLYLVYWTHDNKFWMYGGYSAASVTSPADLWVFDPSIEQWAWISGDETSVPPSYESGNAYPGSRTRVAFVKDPSSPSLYLFGGFYSSTGTFYNDLWKLDTETLTWSLLYGSASGESLGTQGTPGPDNYPGIRQDATLWFHPEGDLYLFGGYPDNLGRSDLWRFHLDINQWEYVKGDPSGSFNTRGELNVPSPDNIPEGRWSQYVLQSADKSSMIMLGGYGYGVHSANTPPLYKSYYADIWTLEEDIWTWIGGSPFLSVNGSWEEGKGVASPNHYPAGLADPAIAMGEDGKWWIYGGFGIGGNRNVLMSFEESVDPDSSTAGSSIMDPSTTDDPTIDTSTIDAPTIVDPSTAIDPSNPSALESNSKGMFPVWGLVMAALFSLLVR